MANSIKVLFWLHRSKINANGEAPLILRLSLKNERTQRATGFYLQPKQWNSKRQRVTGNSEPLMKMNIWIDSVRVKVLSIERDLARCEHTHLPTIIDSLFAKPKEEISLVGFFTEHNNELKKQVPDHYAYSTYEKYVFTIKKVRSFLRSHLKRKDILLKDITTSFIIDFDQYIRVKDKNQHNTAVRYCMILKRILNVAVMRGYIPLNPFLAYKTVYKDTAQTYLDETRLNKIINARLIKENLCLVRDLFLFQCFTGMAYTDMINLHSSDFANDDKGRLWIVKKRQKTGVECTIPVLPVAESILKKYSQKSAPGTPMIKGYSIQKYNKYLHEIGDLIGLDRKLSSHVGRRTFGNIALGRGISLNVISKILGHTNTIVTQRIYAITSQEIISRELERWG